MVAMDAASDPSAPADDATRAAAPGGVSGANDTLFATLYRELHRLARREAARAGPRAVLSPTTLLHEAYLDLAHFLAYAARAMRSVVIDRARASATQKRGGGLDITSLDTQTAEGIAEPAVLSEIGIALDELAEIEPELANVVDLKFFCGFSVAEIANLHAVSERTVQRQWEKARMLLYHALAG